MTSTLHVVSVGSLLPEHTDWFGLSQRVGFTITDVQLAHHVKEYINANSVTNWSHLGGVIGGVKNIPTLRWANPLDVKNVVERIFTETFGPKETGKVKIKVSNNPYFSMLHCFILAERVQ